MDIAEIDIPQYFVCPISLQIMKDPVTTVTGITYDRETIQQWLVSASVCPVTKQPLPHGSDLTPNHMLRRLIQAWCVANANNGIDRIPTPKSPLNRSLVLKLVRDINRMMINSSAADSNYGIIAVKKLDQLAAENDKNRQCLRDNGVAKAMVLFLMRCFGMKHGVGVEEALRVLHLTWAATSFENRNLLEDDVDFVRALLWVLRSDDIKTTAKTHALMVLRHVSEVASTTLLEGLTQLDFFREIVKFLRNDAAVSPQATKAALHILIQLSGRSRTRIIEAGAVFALVEMEWSGSPEKRISELIFCLLAKLCSCAEGRQQLLKHAGGLAVVAKRVLRVSAATDDRAVYVMESIARFSATREVVQEMLRVGAVAKLCMVLQADCPEYLRKKVREILRLHSNAWSNSPCVHVYLLTCMNPR